MFHIKLKKDKKAEMIKRATLKIQGCLSKITPPFNSETDEIRLSRYLHESGHINLTYEIIRDARCARSKENRSPYREIGMSMQVGRNS